MLHLREKNTSKIQFGTDSVIALEGRHKMSSTRLRPEVSFGEFVDTFVPREKKCAEQRRSGVKIVQDGPADLNASKGRSRSNDRPAASEEVGEESRKKTRRSTNEKLPILWHMSRLDSWAVF
jgi:hypothetical protein